MIYEDVELMKLTKELTVVHKEYENKFGKGSLNYRRGHNDPVHPNVEDIKQDIEEINNAIKTGKKLPTIDAELWNKLIF
ncbi:hypothetical protein LSGJ_01732 [Ligilactobacillus salivarius GJ-24]|uniref:Uncharacterized protein n=3 Tax=Ligilactobacillus salivarius TaxID=1624 RepID=F7QWG3_9LACO|nr:hypothetical protein [Ligilactobacillus salivarius]EGL98075.1 hypothetical protein NIAS840_01824 [Ligilactobacillus salivarius NIAS840]EGM49670.1 hypothetical protein LSGJ_01732 [Ligilactobacillus salivarius GJ-24]